MLSKVPAGIGSAGDVNGDGYDDLVVGAWQYDMGGVDRGIAMVFHGGPAGLDAYLENYAAPEDGVPISMGLTCETCHTGEDYAGDAPLKQIEKVVFPGGAEVMNTDGDSSFLCMTCHQGNASTDTVDDAIATAGADGGVLGDDVQSDELGFINIHYYAAAATKYGTEAMGGYEYDGKTYAVRSDWEFGQPLFDGIINGEEIHVQVRRRGQIYTLSRGGSQSDVRILNPRAAELYKLMPVKEAPDTSGQITAPMPGLLVSVAVAEGDEVKVVKITGNRVMVRRV